MREKSLEYNRFYTRGYSTNNLFAGDEGLETIDKKIQEDSRELSEDIRADFTDGEYVPDSEAKAPAVSPVAEAEINKGRRLARVQIGRAHV